MIPIPLDRRARRFGAAVIGYLGAVAHGWALVLVQEYGCQPDAIITSQD